MNSPAKRIIILTVLFLSVLTTYAQKQIIGANHNATADISTLYSKTHFFQNNASFLAFTPTKTTNLTTKQSYISSEIATHSIGVSSPIKEKSGIGIHVMKDGIKSFNTTSLGLSYGTLLSEHLALGIQTNFQYLQIQNQYTKIIIIPEISIAGKFNEKWNYSAILHNPTRQTYNKELRYTSESELIIGTNYSKENFKLAIELNKISSESPLVKIGGQYELNQKLHFCFGFKTNSSITGGLAYILQQISLSLATAYHTTLGLSPTLSLRYEILKKT